MRQMFALMAEFFNNFGFVISRLLWQIIALVQDCNLNFAAGEFPSTPGEQRLHHQVLTSFSTPLEFKTF